MGKEKIADSNLIEKVEQVSNKLRKCYSKDTAYSKYKEKWILYYLKFFIIYQ